MRQFLLFSGNNEYTELLHFNVEKDGSVPGLEWEGDDEFRLKGEMYDVVEKKLEGNSMTIRCISDLKETMLLKDYEGAGKNDFGNTANNKYLHWLKLATSVFTLPVSAMNGPGRCMQICFLSFYQTSYHVIPADIPTPPPWKVS